MAMAITLESKANEIKRNIEDFVDKNYKATDIIHDETAAKCVELFRDAIRVIELYRFCTKAQGNVVDDLHGALKTLCSETERVLDNFKEI